MQDLGAPTALNAKKPWYNFIVGPPNVWSWICRFNEVQIIYWSMYLFLKIQV